jgi:hemerythrin superfamily protein
MFASADECRVDLDRTGTRLLCWRLSPSIREFRMPTARTSEDTRKTARKSAKPEMDAIQLLKADHRQVEEWFEEFEKSRSDDKKEKLAHKICTALTVHTQIEEEIFYPAYLDATGDDEMHDEAHVEHDGAKKLIAEIEMGKPGENMWEAKVSVLSEMIKHHVHEEEMRDGMFAKAKKSSMDLDEIGMQLAARKKELMKDAGKL